MKRRKEKVRWRGRIVSAGYPARHAEAQRTRTATIRNDLGQYVVFGRITFGDEHGAPEAQIRCHDCDVECGEYHLVGCDVEVCPQCQGQAIGCGCSDDMGDISDVQSKTVQRDAETQQKTTTYLIYVHDGCQDFDRIRHGVYPDRDARAAARDRLMPFEITDDLEEAQNLPEINDRARAEKGETRCFVCAAEHGKYHTLRCIAELCPRCLRRSGFCGCRHQDDDFNEYAHKPGPPELTFYVRDHGNDLTGEGTEDKPFRSISRAQEIIAVQQPKTRMNYIINSDIQCTQEEQKRMAGN